MNRDIPWEQKTWKKVALHQSPWRDRQTGQWQKTNDWKVINDTWCHRFIQDDATGWIFLCCFVKNLNYLHKKCGCTVLESQIIWKLWFPPCFWGLKIGKCEFFRQSWGLKKVTCSLIQQRHKFTVNKCTLVLQLSTLWIVSLGYFSPITIDDNYQVKKRHLDFGMVYVHFKMVKIGLQDGSGMVKRVSLKPFEPFGSKTALNLKTWH